MSLNDRQQAFEGQYKHDQELKFKIGARRARLFGEWVGQEAGLTGDAVTDMGKEFVKVDMEQPGDEDILAHALNVLSKTRIDLTKPLLQAKLNQLEGVAAAQVQAERSAS
jgi:hypothetical protein